MLLRVIHLTQALFCLFFLIILLLPLFFFLLQLDTTMLESMWDSMSSSMQLAQECLERNEEEDASDLNDPSNMDGLEKFAQTIDNSEFTDR